MSFEDTQKALEVEFLDNWGDKSRVAMQNLAFQPDKTVEPGRDVQSAWVRFTVLQGAGEIQGLGAATKMYRYIGMIIVSVFVVEGIGTLTSRALCDEVATLFRSKQLADENISCQTPSIVEVGASKGWWQVNVEIPFYWDEFTNP
ncbi:hypothetical protein LCGC14_2407450 [marine sediment metagenome]|uniref:Uncharacterized protein n=1 Tax=marine sediment metagenome TaxID=412755 RepID=A0A0F9BTL5_9ZZZZ